MGLGKMLKIGFTQQVKCDNCGAVIIDGTYNSNPRYAKWGDGSFMTDAFGQIQEVSNQGGDGVGVLNTLIYGSKSRVLCKMCQTMEKFNKKMEQTAAEENARLEGHLALEQENLRLQNELLKQQLENEARARTTAPVASRPAPVEYIPAPLGAPPAESVAAPVANRTAPVASRPAPVCRANNFCSGCGSPLKQGAKFCSKCGKRLG